MRLMLAFAMLLSIACSEDGPDFPGLDDELRVAFGHSILIPEESLIIRFKELNEDFRCPIDVVCAGPGWARITLTLSRGNATPEDRTLAIPSGLPASYLHYEITLLELLPQRLAFQTPVPEEYVATLVVTK